MCTLHRLARTLFYLAVLAHFLVTVAADLTALRHDAGHGVQYAANTTLFDDDAGRWAAGNFSTQMPGRLEAWPLTRRSIGSGGAEGRAGDESGRDVWVDAAARDGGDVGGGTVVRRADGQIGSRAGRGGNGAEGAGAGAGDLGRGRRATVVGLETAAPGRQAVSVAVLSVVVLAVLWIWVCVAG